MRRLSIVSVVAGVIVLAFAGLAPASELYKWTDADGVLHVATSLEDVPERYRDQVTRMKLDVTAPSTTPPPVATPEDPQAAPQATDDSGLLRFSIPYQNEGTARRVIIPVTFNGMVTAPMALDTGSPGLVISLDLAIRLGIFDRDSGTLITAAGGIGGSTPAILTIVDSVAVEGAHDEFVPTTVTVESISTEFDGLIGMDFLANYNISIDTREQVVIFQQVPPPAESRGGHSEEWWRQTFQDFRAVSDGWRDYVRSASRRSGTRVTPFAEFQAREAERLLQRLDHYASDKAVPRHWR